MEVEEPSAFAGAGKIMQVTQTQTQTIMQVTNKDSLVSISKGGFNPLKVDQ